MDDMKTYATAPSTGVNGAAQAVFTTATTLAGHYLG